MYFIDICNLQFNLLKYNKNIIKRKLEKNYILCLKISISVVNIKYFELGYFYKTHTYIIFDIYYDFTLFLINLYLGRTMVFNRF